MGDTDIRHLLLVRHGETDANAQGIIQGHLQTGLSDVGLRQARGLATRLARWVPTIGRVLTSDLRRAVQTAEQIAAKCGLEVQRDPAWREMSAGVLEGKTVAEHNAWFEKHGLDAVPPGAESSSEFDTRIARAMHGLPSRFGDARAVVLVSHGGPICTVHRMVLDGALPLISHSATPALGLLRNCSIMHLVWYPTARAWELRTVNDAMHLDDQASC
jgi:glucosyl-3-phosphoglycerate phosphatase